MCRNQNKYNSTPATHGYAEVRFQNDPVLQQRSCNNSEELSLKEIKNADLQGSYQNGNRVYQTYRWQQEIVNNLTLHRSDDGFLRECAASEIDSM